MATHHLPKQPNVDTVWTRDWRTGEAVRWNRIPVEVDGLLTRDGRPPRRVVWVRPGVDATGGHTWPELLAEHGPVLEQHPDLPDGAPLPWTWYVLGGVEDAHGYELNLADDELAGFVVRAANAYAARANGGEQITPLSPTRYTAAVDDLAALWSGAQQSVRDAVDVQCGGLVDALDRLLAAVRDEQ